MNDIATLHAVASLGQDAKNFKEGDVGRYLLGCAEQQSLSAIELLKHADPTDVKEITRLQNIICRAEDFEGWVDEAIESGLSAINEYQTEE